MSIITRFGSPHHGLETGPSPPHGLGWSAWRTRSSPWCGLDLVRQADPLLPIPTYLPFTYLPFTYPSPAPPSPGTARFAAGAITGTASSRNAQTSRHSASEAPNPPEAPRCTQSRFSRRHSAARPVYGPNAASWGTATRQSAATSRRTKKWPDPTEWDQATDIQPGSAELLPQMLQHRLEQPR